MFDVLPSSSLVPSPGTPGEGQGKGSAPRPLISVHAPPTSARSSRFRALPTRIAPPTQQNSPCPVPARRCKLPPSPTRPTAGPQPPEPPINPTPLTNRDLYLAITQLTDGPHPAPARDLETYLRALLRLTEPHANTPSLTPGQFLSLLTAALTADPAPYDPAWETAHNAPPAAPSTHSAFKAILTRQIVDLHEMRAAGTLDRKHIDLGVTAPRGGTWYNFSIPQYLECATAGSVGGWEPGDPTPRTLVPGPVAVPDPDGNLTSADPHDIERPVHPLHAVTWDQLADFLYCGQIYE